MLNIVIPMAGYGSRFAKAGFQDPKPLIQVLGKPMIQLVIENLTPNQEHRFIFICQDQHLSNYPLRSLLESMAPDCKIIPVNKVTEGAACTVLLAKKYIDNSDPLMIANCDQYIDFDANDYLAQMDGNGLDGLIMTMYAYDNKWSFVELNNKEEIVRVVEKEVISDQATVGIYNFAVGADFVRFAELMINKNLRVNGEFYVAPVYNEMILAGKKILRFNIGSLGQKMFGLGTPEDLSIFLNEKKFSE